MHFRLTAADGLVRWQSLASETLRGVAAFVILVQDRFGELRPTRHWCFVPD
jgi:hypothetical protein